MHLAITDTTDNIGGMVARHLSARRLPLILPLNTPVVWDNHANFHL